MRLKKSFEKQIPRSGIPKEELPPAQAADNTGPTARFMGLLLVLLVVVAYLPAFHAGFIWDDDRYVTANPLLEAPDGLWRIWFSMDSPSQYFPLTYTVLRLEYAMWGLLPAGYHTVNIMLHAVNVLLVWRLLVRLAMPGAWLAAAIFAIHPVQVESVAWVTELKNLLSLFFILLGGLAWLKFIRKESQPDWRQYFVALFCQALALAAKSTASTMPAALLLLLWYQKKPITGRRLGQLVPFLLLAAGSGLMAMWWERYHQGTQGRLFTMGIEERILVASHALFFYLGKLCWPVNLMFSYPRWTVNPASLLQWCWLAAAAALTAVIWFARRWTGRGPETAMVFFLITLCPVLGFIMLFTFLYSFVADHYQYIACIGPIALAAAGITKLCTKKANSRFCLPVSGAALLLVLGILTWRQCGTYADQEVLWRTTIERNPRSWMAYANLAAYLSDHGRDDEAISELKQGLKFKPDEVLAYYDLGVIYSRQGHVEAAIANFQQALALDPDVIMACDRLAWTLATCPIPALQNGPKALELATHANQLSKGRDANVLSTLGAAEACTGHYPEAIMAIQTALKLAPEQDPSLTNALLVQLNFYQNHSTFRDLTLTNSTMKP